MYQIHLLNLILLLPYNNYTHETFNFDFLLYPLEHNIIIVKLKSRFLQLLQTSLHVFVLIMIMVRQQFSIIINLSERGRYELKLYTLWLKIENNTTS